MVRALCAPQMTASSPNGLHSFFISLAHRHTKVQTPRTKTMAPPKWATVEEEEFFQAHSAKYQVCQAKRNYTGFWEPVFEEWFATFPEWLRIYKEIPLDVDLTVEQKTVVGKAVENRRQQIMNKFKNDMGSSKVNRRTKNRNNRMMTAGTTTASTSLEPAVTSKKSMVAQMMSSARPVRSPQVTEVFSKLFFEDMIKPTLDLAFETAKAEAEAKAAAENTKVNLPSKIAILKKQTYLLYHSASDEVKQQVAEFIEDAKKKKKKECEEAKGAAVVDHQVYIDRLPGTLNEFFNELQRLTGLVFTVLMGGPTPTMGGQIEVQSFHVGATEIGNQFDQAYPEFDLEIMRPWKEFVKHVFPVAVAKEEGSVWSGSRQPTLEPALCSDGHVSQTPNITSDGAFGNIPRDSGTFTMASSSDTLFSHMSKPLTSFFDDDENLTLNLPTQFPMPTAFPSYPSHSVFASSTDLGADGADGVSSMLSVEGYHEFLRTYGAPQAISTLQPPLSQHGPTLPSTPPTPKPLTSEVTTPANDAIAAQQGPSPSTQSSSVMTQDSPANFHLQPLSESNSAEAAPFESTSAEAVPPTLESMSAEAVPSAPEFTSAEAVPPGEESTSAEAAPSAPEFTSADAAPSGKESTSTEAAPLESTSAEAVPSASELTSAEAVPSGKVTASLVVSRGKQVRQISKRNEIANSIGSENTGSKKRGSSGVNGVHKK
ncbi:hypothetical protein F4604DRAFT_1912762 [Suillus subluteus]|nr:hypothetical protein F4604DRAFT_1912762 [Suillus subluteus]